MTEAKTIIPQLAIHRSQDDWSESKHCRIILTSTQANENIPADWRRRQKYSHNPTPTANGIIRRHWMNLFLQFHAHFEYNYSQTLITAKPARLKPKTIIINYTFTRRQANGNIVADGFDDEKIILTMMTEAKTIIPQLSQRSHHDQSESLGSNIEFFSRDKPMGIL